MRRLILLGLVLASLSTALGSTGPAGASTPERQPIVVRVDDGGFHWTDAAIGAGAGAGLVLLLVGAAGPGKHRRAARLGREG